MSGTAQAIPVTSPEIMAGRRESAERIKGYDAIEATGGRSGAVIREVGRVAERDLEFALELVRDFDPDLKINALTAIARNSGELGPLSDARDHAETEDLGSIEKSRKLASISKAAADIDAVFAFDTARAIPRPASKVDTLLEVAKRSKAMDKLNNWSVEKIGSDPKDINFSIGLLREIVREADRVIDASGTFKNDPRRNRKLAEISAGFDLGVTYRAAKRREEFIEHTRPVDPDTIALHSVQGHIRGYISEDDFEGLEEADPGGEITIAAFKARVSEYGGEGDRLASRLNLDDELLDPVGDAVDLLRNLQHLRNMTFQNPNPKLYRELLAVISDGAIAHLVEFDLEEEARKATEQSAPALDSWED